MLLVRLSGVVISFHLSIRNIYITINDIQIVHEIIEVKKKKKNRKKKGK